MPLTPCRTWSPASLAILLASLATPVAAADFAGLVDIGSGRKMYLECNGTGSPTVVLISGKGNGAADWHEVLDPADPAHDADYDAVAWGKGYLHKSDSAVFPTVSRFTRVCAYDRPGVRLDGPDQSTPVPQPHPADQAADDLHRLLIAAGEPGPYVLVPHSYGGVVATLFARTWPADVAGLVMVDALTPLIRDVASPEAVAKWDALNRTSVPEAPEAVMVLDAFAKIDAAAPLRELPAVVLASDKPWQPPSTPQESDPAAGVTFADWRASQKLLAASLGARFVADTNSGHNIYAYAPQLVVDAIREVVEAVRAGADSATRSIDPELGAGPAIAAASVVVPAAADDIAGLVEIGGGRKLYLECRGSGAPTVVLISGGWEAGWIWTYALAPDDPVQALPYDAFSAGGGSPSKLDTAVFPAVAKFTRVCLYDRPNTTVGEDIALERGGLVSTPVPQPHALADDVADLHALLAAAGEAGPVVLAAHSYGGLIAELYARRYPGAVAGEVLVDVTSVYLRDTFTPEEYAEMLRSTSLPVAEGQEALQIAGGFDAILAAPPAPAMPVVLLTAGKLAQDAPASRRDELMAAHDRLAAQLGARHVTDTASGHHIHVEQPQLVTDAIRAVVDAVRAGKTALGP